jgi:hypothetical protein
MLTRRELLLWTPPGAALSLSGACAEPDRPAATSSPSRSAPAPTPTTPTTDPQTLTREQAYRQLTQDLRGIDLPSHVSFGMALYDRVTGLQFAYRGDHVFETASIAKVDILTALLLQAQARGTPLSALQRSQAERMIRFSSNDDAWDLWRAVGAKAGLDRANRRLGLTHTTIVSYSWGLARTTPRDQVRLVGKVARPDTSGLTRGSSAYALKLMRSVTPEQAWGVSAAARKGETTAVKNGWLPRSTEGERWIANSIGVITGKAVDLRLAVLSHGHADYGRGIALVETVARLARANLYPR